MNNVFVPQRPPRLVRCRVVEYSDGSFVELKTPNQGTIMIYCSEECNLNLATEYQLSKRMLYHILPYDANFTSVIVIPIDVKRQ